MAEQEKEKAQESFTVVDKRSRRWEEAEEAPTKAKAAEAPKAEPLRPEPPKREPVTPASTEAAPPGLGAEADFTNFILMLSSSALVYLGEAADQSGRRIPPDLAQAKYTLDLLEMLQRKTQGNLTPEESRLLDDALYDLRMRYVKLVQALQRPPRPGK